VRVPKVYFAFESEGFRRKSAVDSSARLGLLPWQRHGSPVRVWYDDGRDKV